MGSTSFFVESPLPTHAYPRRGGVPRAYRCDRASDRPAAGTHANRSHDTRIKKFSRGQSLPARNARRDIRHVPRVRPGVERRDDGVSGVRSPSGEGGYGVVDARARAPNRRNGLRMRFAGPEATTTTTTGSIARGVVSVRVRRRSVRHRYAVDSRPRVFGCRPVGKPTRKVRSRLSGVGFIFIFQSSHRYLPRKSPISASFRFSFDWSGPV